jgi:hypothetical protein
MAGTFSRFAGPVALVSEGSLMEIYLLNLVLIELIAGGADSAFAR